MGLALRLRWLWLARTDTTITWLGFKFSRGFSTKAFFDASVSIKVGNGERALFWEDNWSDGCSIKILAPKPLGDCFGAYEKFEDAA